MYDKTHIWISAKKDELSAHLWHKYYSAHTKVLQPLACRVCSKILGIGSAERSWKKVKKNKSGDRSRLSSLKAKMQATIAGIHAAENNEEDRAKKMRAGVVWDDDDFETLGLDAHCLPLDVAPDDEVKRRTTRIFRAWLESWEEVGTGPQGDPVLEQRVLRKYGGLKFIDPDTGKEFTVHRDRSCFEKERGNNRYELFCTLDGFDDSIADDQQPDMYEPWCRDLVVDEIAEYYKLHDNEGVVIYKDGDIESSDGEDDDAVDC